MNKWARLAAKLYPASWRRRYGVEFDALLDDTRSGWRDTADVFWGAMMMQLSRSYLSMAVACGLAGLMIAAGWAFSRPGQYVSQAVVRITPSQIPEDLVPATYNRQMAERVNQLLQGVCSRASLAELIQRPTLQLYKGDRKHKPLEEIIEQMKSRDIRIEIMGMGTRAKPASWFVVSFSYPDRFVAQQVTSALVTKLADANQVAARGEIGKKASATLDLLDPPSLPQAPTAPMRWPMVLSGLVAGMLAGLLAVALRRRAAV